MNMTTIQNNYAALVITIVGCKHGEFNGLASRGIPTMVAMVGGYGWLDMVGMTGGDGRLGAVELSVAGVTPTLMGREVVGVTNFTHVGKCAEWMWGLIC